MTAIASMLRQAGEDKSAFFGRFRQNKAAVQGPQRALVWRLLFV